MLTKIKYFVKRWEKTFQLTTAIFLIVSLSFSLGFICGGKIISRPPLIVDQDLMVNLDEPVASSSQEVISKKTIFVASSKGKYYYPIDCSLVENLSDKNKIYFQTKEEAEAKGYIYNTKCQ